jgi:hypothetical protein
MLPKFGFVFMWFTFVIFIIFGNLIILNTYNTSKPEANKVDKQLTYYPQIKSSGDEGSSKMLEENIDIDDGRILLLDKFMKDSPLEPYSALMVNLADKYNIDYRLLPSIAMCESNLGERIPSDKSFNAWGIAVYTGQQSGAVFQNWPQAIEWVYEYVASKYVDKEIIGLIDVGAIWAPPSVETGNSWANCVDSFMNKIE